MAGIDSNEITKQPTNNKTVRIAIIAAVCLAVIIVAAVFIIPPKVTSVTFEDSSIVIYDDMTYTPKYTVSPAKAAKRKGEWNTTNPNVAIVENGELKPQGLGECKIVYSIGGKSSEINVTVVASVQSIELLCDDQLTLNRFESKNLSYKVTPDDVIDPNIQWSSSDEHVVSVDETGTIRTHGGGTATVTAKAGKHSDSIEITVNGLPYDWSLRKVYDAIGGDGKICTVSAHLMQIRSNPSGEKLGRNYTEEQRADGEKAMAYVKAANKELGIPDSVYEEWMSTSVYDLEASGVQSYSYDDVEVRFNYNSVYGLKCEYRKLLK